MPRLTSYRGGGITSCDLGSNWWRLQIAAVPSGGRAGFALVYRYPPASPLIATGNPTQPWISATEYAQLALAVADVDFAGEVADLKPVADVSIISGDREKDVARVSEAMNLFRNLPRLKDEALALALRDVVAVIDGYWAINRWHRAGCVERLEVTVADAVLVGAP
jgi:hypothetical protein